MFKSLHFTEIFIPLALWCGVCCLAANIAKGKNRSFAGFFWLSFFLSPVIGIIAALIISPLPKQGVQSAPVATNTISDLEHLVKLKESGALTDEEFNREKQKLLQ